MAIREDVVASAVTFLQDPSVAGSPIENRIAFLQSKNLTQEEVDTALARAGAERTPANYTSYASQQQAMRQPQPVYGSYQPYSWHPPDVPKRDWRDWFIMATVMGGMGYGLYNLTIRYVYPMIAPPTAPQLEQDKKAIDESFEKAFALLDRLANDTEELKSSEKARTERLDAALLEVESVIGELKTSSRRREEESRRITDEVRGLKDLIPKAIEGQKESTDGRLKDLNNELKSLKTLMGQRMNSTASTNTSSYNRAPTSSTPTPATPAASASNGTILSESETARPTSVENTPSLQGRSGSPFITGSPGKAAIPSWQMAAANKSTATRSAAGSAGENGSSGIGNQVNGST